MGIFQLSKLLDIGIDGILQKGYYEKEIKSAIDQSKKMKKSILKPFKTILGNLMMNLENVNLLTDKLF